MSTSSYVLSLDFGGTKLIAALVDPANGRIVQRNQAVTPTLDGAQASYEKMIAMADNLIRNNSESMVDHIGISFGGPVSSDRRNIIRSHHVKDWQDYPLPQEITRYFSIPAYMDNDANCAALGECRFGAGINFPNLLYVQISTGIGCGMILNNHIYRSQGLAGEIGHITINADGPICSCGKFGCLESIASGWAIARDGRAALENACDSDPLRSASQNLPENIDAALVFYACRSGSQSARSIIEASVDGLSMGIANSVCTLDPAAVILGGGIIQSWDIILPILNSHLKKYLPEMFNERFVLRAARLNGDETLIGAALLTEGN